MWSDTDQAVSQHRFGSFNPIEVLYEFDGPMIFTAKDEFDGLLLCYQCGESSTSATLDYLVVPTSARCIEHLKTGVLTLYQALDQPWLWALKCAYDGVVKSAWKIDGLSEVPIESKPGRDITLWAHLMPLLSYRLLGEGLSLGKVPASVVAAAVTKPTAALKRLLQVSMPRPVQGRPENTLRSLYDLDAQRMAFNSFEVSFQSVNSEQMHLDDSNSPYAIGKSDLSKAVDWLRSTNAEDDLDLNLLEVLSTLAPPIHGLITATEIKGRLVSDHCVKLSREDTRRVRSAISSKKSLPELMTKEGRVGELDRDKRTFILRQELSFETTFFYDESHFDIIFEAFETEISVNVQGRIVGNSRPVEVIAIELLPASKTADLGL